jgi:hypothetical protein
MGCCVVKLANFDELYTLNHTHTQFVYIVLEWLPLFHGCGLQVTPNLMLCWFDMRQLVGSEADRSLPENNTLWQLPGIFLIEFPYVCLVYSKLQCGQRCKIYTSQANDQPSSKYLMHPICIYTHEIPLSHSFVINHHISQWKNDRILRVIDKLFWNSFWHIFWNI